MSNKLLRSELKSIVKECLIEILSEGILNQDSKNFKRQYIAEDAKNKNISKNKNLSYLDNISYGNSKQRKNNIEKLNTNLTKDPVLNEILADTASSTLTEQNIADRKNNRDNLINIQGDTAARIVDSYNPEELFEESSDKWAALAFS